MCTKFQAGSLKGKSSPKLEGNMEMNAKEIKV